MSNRPLAVITGTTHGIGTVTSHALARGGYDLAMLCRNLVTAAMLAREIMQRAPGSQVEVVHCDLADLSSVRSAAHALLNRHRPIDRLINNAGIVSTRRRFSVDGHELTFATNHLGPFLLTRLLLPALSATARIINVASKVHYRGRMDLDTVDDPRARYSSVAAYSRSKLANVLDTFALARRMAGNGITVNCLHPGVVATNLLPGWLNLIRPLFKRVILSAEQGARTTLYLALEPQAGALHGEYLDEHQQVQPAAAAARDLALQEQLLACSARWTGLDQASA
ncbi:MAG TPA: SDR family NAD(P)-dependent oxidoreductase [Steroidobacteraceae bacterium]|jgi:NAD(P)-dependent dehydrogenase (short-subunit alcohol dehydrogenase family)|nr:SDR family NAD(P)-dependent oxidoreductase [Steroidobacteraceae bacterium]